MKKFKKIIACGLALALVVMQFSALTLTANAIGDVDYSQYTDTEKVNSAIAALSSDSNLTYGYGVASTLTTGKVLIECTEFGVKGTGYGSFHSDGGKTTEGFENNIFDGIATSASDVNIHNNGHQFYYLKEDGTYKENTYVDITIALKFNADINRVFLAQRTAVDLHSCEYEIYMGDSYDTLYTDANRKFYYEDTPKAQYQVFDLEETVSAKLVGIRILKGVTLSFPHGYAASYARLAEIAVFGEYNDPAFIYDSVVDEKRARECINNLTSEYNLMQSGYVTGKIDKPSYIVVTGQENGVKLDNFGKLYSYDHGTADNGVFDGKLSSNADVNVTGSDGNPMSTVGEDKNTKPNTHIDISVCLTYPAVIDKLFVSNRSDTALMTHKYAVFTSNDFDTLYNDENKKFDYTNTLKAQYQTIDINATETAKYVGIRIYEAVETPFTAYGVGSGYPRLEEIAVFGKYDLDYFDYNVTANVDEVINESGKTYSGKVKSYDVPLFKADSMFKGWQINGENVPCEINQYKGAATLEFTVDKAIEAKAIYEPITASLTSENYAIDEEKSLVRIPQNEIFYTASTAFNIYRDKIVATKDDSLLKDGDYITAGTKIGVDGKTDGQLTVVSESDYDLNGTVEVTDVIAAIEGILNNIHEEDATFAFDANGSGKITVSDVVSARKNILNNVRYEFAEKSITLSKLNHKKMGRTSIEEDGSLYLDLTASGFSFNAYCFGDVSVETSGEATWFTVIVDGKEKDLLLGEGGKQSTVIAENLPAGKHTFELYKQSEGDHFVNVNSVTLSGEVLDAPENAELLIEFAGDSITCGFGNVVEKDRVGGARTTDGYKSYGAQTARLLGADWSNVSLSGAALIYKEGMGKAHIPTVYKQKTFQKTESYDFARKSDIVVINLGTNDAGLLKNLSVDEQKAYFLDDARKFVDYILENNGADTKIVFAFGMMTDPNHFDEVYIDLAAELQEEGTDAFYCRLPTNREGADDHPNVAGDLAAAEVLAEFIKTNVLG